MNTYNTENIINDYETKKEKFKHLSWARLKSHDKSAVCAKMVSDVLENVNNII